MKKKILYILVAALLYILTQLPTIVSNYYFEPGEWDIARVFDSCRTSDLKKR